MKIFRKVLIGGVSLVLAASLAACGTSTNTATSTTKSTTGATTASSTKATTAATKAPEKVTLIYARGKDATGATQKEIAAFEKKYPNITVNFLQMPSDTGQSHDQYVTKFSQGAATPDVFDNDVIWPPEFAQAGYAQPLDQFIKKDNIDLSTYFPGPIAAANFNGHQYALPRFIDAGLLFYRKDIVSTPPKTWDELYKLAKANAGKNGTKYGYLMQAKQYEGMICDAVEFIASYGGSIIKDGKVTINSANTKAGLEEMKKIATSSFVPKDTFTYAEGETANAFVAGKAVFARNWPYMWALAQDPKNSKVVGKVGVAPLPAGTSGSAATLGGWMMMMNKNSKHKKEAWELMSFMAGPEGQKLEAIYGGHAPTISALYQDADVLKANPFFANKDFVKGLSVAVPRPVSPVYPKLSDIMQNQIEKYLKGGQSVDKALSNMQTQLSAAQQ